MKLKTLAASICLLASAQIAQGALVDFYGVGVNASTKEASFKGAVTGPSLSVDTLEDPNDSRGWGLLSGGSATGTIDLIFESVSPAGTTTLGSTLIGSSQITSTASGGRAPHSGVSYWEGQNFTITFAAATSAFGFWGSDIGDFSSDCPTCGGGAGQGLTVELFDAGNVSLGSYAIAGSPDNASELFWGFVDTGGARVKSIKFTNNTGGLDGQGFDDLMIGAVRPDFQPPTNPTPEPGALALVGLALAGAARARRRVR